MNATIDRNGNPETYNYETCKHRTYCMHKGSCQTIPTYASEHCKGHVTEYEPDTPTETKHTGDLQELMSRDCSCGNELWWNGELDGSLTGKCDACGREWEIYPEVWKIRMVRDTETETTLPETCVPVVEDDYPQDGDK